MAKQCKLQRDWSLGGTNRTHDEHRENRRFRTSRNGGSARRRYRLSVETTEQGIHGCWSPADGSGTRASASEVQLNRGRTAEAVPGRLDREWTRTCIIPGSIFLRAIRTAEPCRRFCGTTDGGSGRCSSYCLQQSG